MIRDPRSGFGREISNKFGQGPNIFSKLRLTRTRTEWVPKIGLTQAGTKYLGPAQIRINMTERDRLKMKSQTGPNKDRTKKFKTSDRTETNKLLKFADLFGPVSLYTGWSVDPCLWWYLGCWPWCDWCYPWYISWLCFWLWYFQGSLHRTISFRKLHRVVKGKREVI